MENYAFDYKKHVLALLAIAAIFAIATFGARGLQSQKIAESNVSSSGQLGSPVAQIEHSGFQVTLKNLTTTLSSWAARKPEDEAY